MIHDSRQHTTRGSQLLNPTTPMYRGDLGSPESWATRVQNAGVISSATTKAGGFQVDNKSTIEGDLMLLKIIVITLTLCLMAIVCVYTMERVLLLPIMAIIMVLIKIIPERRAWSNAVYRQLGSRDESN